MAMIELQRTVVSDYKGQPKCSAGEEESGSKVAHDASFAMKATREVKLAAASWDQRPNRWDVRPAYSVGVNCSGKPC